MIKEKRKIAWISGIRDDQIEEKYPERFKLLNIDFLSLDQEIPNKEKYFLFVFESSPGVKNISNSLEKLLSSAKELKISLKDYQRERIFILSEVALLYIDQIEGEKFNYHVKTKKNPLPSIEMFNDLIYYVPEWKRKLKRAYIFSRRVLKKVKGCFNKD